MIELKDSQKGELNKLNIKGNLFDRKGSYSWELNERIIDGKKKDVVTIRLSEYDGVDEFGRPRLTATTDRDIDANLDKLDLEKEIDKGLKDIHYSLDSLPEVR